MDPRTNRTVIGIFTSWDKAESAIDELLDEGFLDSEIGAVTREGDGISNRTTRRNRTKLDNEEDDTDDAASGAITGAAAGAGIGGLIGLAVLSGVAPIIGPALFAGTLGVLASNAAGGAAVAGIIGALTAWGMSEDDARYYEGEIAAGRVIVTVAAGNRAEKARAILGAHGATTRDAAVSATAY